MQHNKILILSFMTLCLVVIFIYGIVLSLPIRCEGNECRLNIDEHSSINKISSMLNEQVGLNKFLFKCVIKSTFNDRNIKYGRYDLKSISTLKDLITLITSVSKDRVKVTIVEGWTIQDIAIELEKKLNIDVEKFISICFDKNLIDLIDSNSRITNLEGFLFPDTYVFLKTYTEKDIIHILLDQFIIKYNKNVVLNNQLNIYDTIILASIIQAESKYKVDMDTISSVYNNRLKENMLLQADPTIQYILPEKKQKLLYKDTKIKNPYNTYINYGLPPGPINSPGLDAIIAASNPPNTNYLYFVADGKGTHIFNTTYNRHLKSKKNAIK